MGVWRLPVGVEMKAASRLEQWVRSCPYRKGGAHPVGIAPEPKRNPWGHPHSSGLKTRNMRGQEQLCRQQDSIQGRLEGQMVGSGRSLQQDWEGPPCLAPGWRDLVGSSPAQGSVLGITGLGYNSQKLCQALSQTQGPENRGEGRGSSESPSPLSSPVQDPWMDWRTELQRNYSAIPLHPYCPLGQWPGQHLLHLENISSVEIENAVS